MTHTELDLRERRRIEDLHNAGVAVRQIAADLNRHRSTIYREIKRNRFTDSERPHFSGYYGVTAQTYAKARRAHRHKLLRLDGLREAVIDRLKAGWSPEQIAGRPRYEGHATRVCHETIYAYVYSREGQTETLARNLPERRKRRKPRYARKPRDLVFPADRSIQNRPDAIDSREVFGDWGGRSDDLSSRTRERECRLAYRAQDTVRRAVPQQRPQFDPFRE